MADLKRFPSVTRKHFIECSGNGLTEWNKPTLKTVQGTHGLLSTSEWTGVQFATIAREVGLKDGGAWVLAEGADAAVMTRSIPMEKMLKDAILAYGQNGEAIRPEQGYPLRLLLPGYEGNTHIKWLRRLEISDKPFMTREETSKYTDLLADGKARQFSLDMEAKSVITFPSGEMKLPGPGFYNISGLAWSGRGRVQSVDVSTDGGKTWVPAQLESAPEPICTVRFSLPVDVGRQAGGAAKPLHRRNRLCPADARTADRHPRLERSVRLDLPPQRDPELGRCSGRECHQCSRVILIACRCARGDDCMSRKPRRAQVAGAYGFGTPATPDELAKFFSIPPDGRGCLRAAATPRRAPRSTRQHAPRAMARSLRAIRPKASAATS